MIRSSVAEDVRTRPEATKKGERRLKVSLVFFPILVVALSFVTIVGAAVWDSRGTQNLAAAISDLEARTHDAASQLPTTGRSDLADVRREADLRWQQHQQNEFRGIYEWRVKRVRPVVTVASWGAALAGMLTLVMGISIIRQIRGLADNARRSRDALLDSFTLGIRRLPWWLISFTSIFAISVLLLAVASFSAAVTYTLETGVLTGNPEPVSLATSLASFLLGLMGLTYSFFSVRGSVRVRHAIRTAFEPEPVEIMGRSVAESEAPLLWRLVRDVATRAGAAMPERITIGLNEGFFVTENPVALSGGQTFAGGRTLFLPLTFLAFMTRPEVEAVIGHELGHFMGEDGKYSIRFAPLFHRASSSLIATQTTRTHLRGIEATLCEYFLSAFHAAVRYWSRLRELAADQVGARAAGADAMANALLRIAAVSPRVSEALEICRQSGEEARRGVLSLLSQLVAEKGMADPDIDLGDQQPHPFDSHPPMRQRIATVGVAITPAQLRDARDTRPGTLLAELQLAGGGAEVVGQSVGDERAHPAAVTASTARPTLHGAVEEEFSGVFGEERRKRIALLGPTAAQGVEPLSLFRLSGMGPYVALPFGALFTWGAVVVIREGMLDVGLVLGLAGLFMLVVGGGAIRRAFLPTRPALVLHRDTLTVCAPDIVIPWTEIVDVDVSAMRIYGLIRIGVRITITLHPGKELPGGWKHWSMFTTREHNRLHIEAGRYRKISAGKLAETLMAYWHGAMARQDLAELKAAPEEIARAASSNPA